MNPAAEFHSATRAAQVWLAADCYPQALRCLSIALKHANRLGEQHRNMVLRVLCWVRQAMRGK